MMNINSVLNLAEMVNDLVAYSRLLLYYYSTHYIKLLFVNSLTAPYAEVCREAYLRPFGPQYLCIRQLSSFSRIIVNLM